MERTSTSASTRAEGRASREVDRAQILEKFREEHPELAEAMQLAGEAGKVWEAFERGQDPIVTYSSSTTTRSDT